MRPWPRLALTLSLSWCAGFATAQEPGNVLLVIADDVGVDRIAAYHEHPDAGPTPVIDGLAARGLLFRSAYANPSCSPSRMALLTGRYGFRTGVGSPYGAEPSFTPGPAETFVAEALGSAGYGTGLVGKWHLSGQLLNPASFLEPILVGGFDGHLGSIENLHGPDAYFHWEKNVATGAGSTQQLVTHYATSENVDDALQLIDGWRAAPWFLLLAFNAGHAPFHVPPAGLHSLGVSEASPKPLLYRADVEALDTELGRLLAGIPPAVLARTTIIVMGDNGTPASAMTPPMVPGHFKGTVYEGGIRVPLIVAGHRVTAPGREVRALVHVVDLFQTLLDLTGAPDPGTGIDSISLLPYLVDPDARAAREWVYSESFYPNGFGPYSSRDRAVSDGRFKLIAKKGAPPEFYDLSFDALELHNLLPALDAKQQAAHDRLATLLADLHD